MRIKRAPSAPTLTLATALGLVLLATPQDATAAPEFAKQWAASCSSCHVGAPTELDEQGIAFKLAGYSQDVKAKNPRPKLFFSFVSDVVNFSDDEDMEAPDSAELFTLLRLDRKGRVKLFAIGELSDEEDGMALDFAHGHLQVNPLAERERLSLRIGNIEPITRLWNTDMRRVFESSLWSGVDTATGELSGGGGGHDAHGGSSGRPGVLPGSDWGGDVSSVIGRNLLVAGGLIEDTAFGGVFWKRGGRGFDNSTYSRNLEYGDLSAEEQAAFNQRQTNMAKKWERSVILGLSAYIGDGNRDVFDGSFLSPMDMDQDDHHMDMGDEQGDEHGYGEEGDEHGDEHGEEGEHHDMFLPTRMTGTSRLVGEIKTRWDRYGFYVVGVYGENDYAVGDPEEWDQHGEFSLSSRESNDFFAWAVEGSARFSVTRKLNGRVALRYEELRPETDEAARFEQAVANLTIPIRMMRPALWPYLEASRNLVIDDWEIRAGLKLGY